jgi:beta-lactamase regulating signal transducer with metallopeptidase domain
MSAIDEMLRQPLGQAIGWALLQFVWQGTLIAALTAAILAALRRSGPDVRYVVGTISLALMLTTPVVSMVQSLKASSGSVIPAEGAVALVSERSGNPEPAVTVPTGAVDAIPAMVAERGAVQAASIEAWLPWLVTAWLAGVVLLTLRLFSGWLWIQRMRSHGAQPASAAIQRTAVLLVRRLHIARPVRFLESTRVAVPTVIGWLKPAVLLPASALAGLTAQQLEAILAHELAHIRRHDYVVNLLQAAIETLLFYHPAVWWLSRRIRIERENCCDDLAVSLCGDPVAYAEALAELEGLRSNAGSLALAASGGSLLERVKRLLGAPTHAGRAPGWLAAGVALLVVVSMSAGAVARDVAAGHDQTAVASTPATPAVVAAEAVDASTATTAAPAAFAMASEAARVASAPAVAVASTVLTASAVTAIAAAPARTSAEAIAVAATTPQASIPVVAAAPASATTVQGVQRSTDGEKSGNFVWSDNGKKFEVNYRGDIEFNADDTDVMRMSPGGFLRIKDGQHFGTDNAVEFRADGNGNIERRFWIGTAERPFDAEARKWLASMLPRFIRQSGIGASSRVARFMKSGGAAAVLAEISRVEGSWAKRLYFTELFKQPGLNASAIQQALSQAGREIDSDYELASLLIASNRLVAEDSTRRVYLEAARTIRSDFEQRRVLSSALKTGVMSAPTAAAVLDASTSIDSDYEQASLLIEFARQQPLEGPVRAPFFKSLATVGSDFERRRVLSSVLQRSDLSSDSRIAALEAVALVGSDFDAVTVLQQFLKQFGIEGAERAPFFRAVDSIQSAFERGRVLQVLARRTDLSEATVLEILRSSRGISGNFERAQVLLAVASTQQLSREGRDAYIDAADKLGDYEQGRVLSALVRNERRPPAR